jgi:hypothetical protein
VSALAVGPLLFRSECGIDLRGLCSNGVEDAAARSRFAAQTLSSTLQVA